MKKEKWLAIAIAFIIIAGISVLWYFTMYSNHKENEIVELESYTYQEFLKDLDEEKITYVEIIQGSQPPTGSIKVILEGEKQGRFNVTDVSTIEEMVISHKKVELVVDPVAQSRVTVYMGAMVLVVTLVFLLAIFGRIKSGAANHGAGNKYSSFGKSNAKQMKESENNITFNAVAGLAEEKEDLQEIVDFLKEPGKFTKVGAKIPKGVLLAGPPGTGKTLLAKAIAGEAGVPFFSISGSDFVEMFVGVGASRVRDLFQTAKKQAPCIIFIDEIDAVAKKRGVGMGGGHDEREQTLNQMLVEMDGFGVNEGIIVLAATNRIDTLDSAILRPGRFDRKIGVGRPDIRGREEILKVHAKDKPLAEDVKLRDVAKTTAGFTGAELANLMNEAAIRAAKENRGFITQEDINKSFIKVGIGEERKSRVISEKEKKITAFHESGHAILFHVLPNVGPVYTVSIIPTGMGAAGYTMPLPQNDEMFNSRGKMMEEIMVSFGGRIAEELIFDDITTGASQDIKQATAIARDMVTKYGMSKAVGAIDLAFDKGDMMNSKVYGEETTALIDAEVKKIIDYCYDKATSIINEYKDVLYKSANLLIEKEKIGRKEFEDLFEDDPSENSVVIDIEMDLKKQTKMLEYSEVRFSL
ncbi:cell division protease FtsH [Acetitomaculum ruminis DSM 5522]|uniref:ATP-dependent zinc metalloprotease FtsH n=1 Tax=Acetitomaculum ruminis DSM 5522 TaxID=1120918 RepID=A0A1I0W2J0_9FIRM|nr:ATP-dependent zinc metalloprotease FtsH [Acetitomaculum ruminis]SFA82548.1 cell division protease FtsH [Acetitomaculum ruminis DSM 5522]